VDRTSFAPELTSSKRNKRDQIKQICSKINEADRYSAAHNGLVAGLSPAGPPANQSLNRFSIHRLLDHRTRNASFSYSIHHLSGTKLLLPMRSDHDISFTIVGSAA
jgi:hypothetical protein